MNYSVTFRSGVELRNQEQVFADTIPGGILDEEAIRKARGLAAWMDGQERADCPTVTGGCATMGIPYRIE
jgi:hypothetical protein